MKTSPTPSDESSKQDHLPVLAQDSQPQVLPSGRTLSVKAGNGTEEIEIRSASGDVEICVKLTDTGPVLSLRGARLEINSSDTISVNCRQLELNASERIMMHAAEDIDIHSGGEIHTQSAQQTFIDGDYVNLNCLDRTKTGYHDDPENLASLVQEEVDLSNQLTDSIEPGDSAPPCCGD